MAENHKEEKGKGKAEAGQEPSGGRAAALGADPPVAEGQVNKSSLKEVMAGSAKFENREKSYKEEMTPGSVEYEDLEESYEEETMKEAERILELLKAFYREGGEIPINFFKFVTDPNSFAQTLDNMYHVFFLVRHGLVRIKPDEDEIPVLEPLDPGQGYVPPQNSGLIPLSIACWEQIVEAFEISQPMIPPLPDA